MTNQELSGQKTTGNAHGRPRDWPRDSWEALEMLVEVISRSFAMLVVFVVNVAFNALWIVLLFWSFGLLPDGIRTWLLGLAGLG